MKRILAIAFFLCIFFQSMDAQGVWSRKLTSGSSPARYRVYVTASAVDSIIAYILNVNGYLLVDTIKNPLTAVVIDDSLSVTYNVAALTFNGFTLKQGASLSDTTKFVLGSDSSATPGTGFKYITPTMLAVKVNLGDSSMTIGSGKYVTPQMVNDSLNTFLHKKDSLVNGGYAGYYVTPTMFNDSLNVFLHKKDSSDVPSPGYYVTPTMLASLTSTVGTKLGKADSSATPDGAKYLTATMGNSNYVALGVTYASIDSFSTTSTTKSITISGAEVGGAVIVTPYTPLYSATADTGQVYSGYVPEGGGSIVIVRTSLSATSTVKSGAIFSYLYIKPR